MCFSIIVKCKYADGIAAIHKLPVIKVLITLERVVVVFDI